MEDTLLILLLILILFAGGGFTIIFKVGNISFFSRESDDDHKKTD